MNKIREDKKISYFKPHYSKSFVHQIYLACRDMLRFF